MQDTMIYTRTDSPEDPIECTVSIKDIYSLLHILRTNSAIDEQTTLRDEIDEATKWTNQRMQDVMDATLIWIAQKHTADVLPYKSIEITAFTKQLLDLGARTHTAISYHTSLLMLSLNDPLRLELLLNLPKHRRPHLDTIDTNGDTALILAAYNDQKYAVWMLMQAGADPTIRNHFGKKASMYTTDFSMIDALETYERVKWENKLPHHAQKDKHTAHNHMFMR